MKSIFSRISASHDPITGIASAAGIIPHAMPVFCGSLIIVQADVAFWPGLLGAVRRLWLQ
jgi:hypothetical protein